MKMDMTGWKNFIFANPGKTAVTVITYLRQQSKTSMPFFEAIAEYNKD